MNSERTRTLLNNMVKKEFPGIDMEIYISSEPDIESYLSGVKKDIFNVGFELSPSDYDKYIGDGIDKRKWDDIRATIRTLLKMLGIYAKVKFYYHRYNG